MNNQISFLGLAMYVAMRQGCCTLERLVSVLKIKISPVFGNFVSILNENIFSQVHMMGLVLTLLYLIGGLGAVVWFVVSHKDEEEISVDERYLCIFISICICCLQR